MLFAVGLTFTGHSNSLVVRGQDAHLMHIGKRVTALSDVVFVAASGKRAVAVTGPGLVFSLKLGETYRIDHDPPYPHVTYEPELLVRRVFSEIPVREVALGVEHGIAVLDNGVVLGWGLDCRGSLCQSMQSPRRHITEMVRMGDLEAVTSVSSAAPRRRPCGLVAPPIIATHCNTKNS